MLVSSIGVCRCVGWFLLSRCSSACAVVGSSRGTAAPDGFGGFESGPGERSARARDRASGGGRAHIASQPPRPGAPAPTRRSPFARSQQRGLNRLVADGGVAHISGDLPVVADMAITNKVTRADKVWAGIERAPRPALAAGPLGQRHRRRGHRSGHRRPRRARRARRRAGSTSCRHEPNVSGDPFGHGTHIAGIIGGSATAATRVTTGVRGRQRAGRAFRRRARARQQRRGLYERRHRRHRLDDRQRAPPRHAHHQPVARPPGRRAVGHRPALPRGRARGAGRPGRRRVCRQLWPDGHGSTRSSAGSRRLATRPGRSRSARSTPPAPSIAATIASRPTARAGPTKFDFAVKPDVVAPGGGHRLARESRLVAEHAVSVVARRRQRPERLLPAERHQHVGRRRERRRRAAARRRAGADAGAGQGRAADRRPVPARRPDSSPAARAAWISRRRSVSRRAGSWARRSRR